MRILRTKRPQACTLVEIVVSLMIVALSMGGIISMYIQAAQRAEYSAQMLAAQMMALGGLEQARAAKFDPNGSPATDELVSSNFPSRFDVLDVGYTSTIVSYATNTFTITTVATNPIVKMVRVDCTWQFPGRAAVITNTVCTYRGPNQ